MNHHTTILLLAALYHESVRHAVGQARPFTEFADLPVDAMRGRLLTAELLLHTLELKPLRPMGDAVEVEPHVDDLAQAIHRAERGAIRRGLVVVKLDPPRPWLPFDKLPEAAQNGRRHQARFLLSRFAVRPRQGGPLQDFDKARARFLSSPHGRAFAALEKSQLRWTGTPAEIEHLLSALEEVRAGVAVAVSDDWVVRTPPNYWGMWQGVMLYEDERGGGFAAEGVGGFTDPETGLWLETVTEGGAGPTLVSTGAGHGMAPVQEVGYSAAGMLTTLALAVDPGVQIDGLLTDLARMQALVDKAVSARGWPPRTVTAAKTEAGARTQVLPNPNGGPPDFEGDDRTAAHINEVAKAQDLIGAAVLAASKCDANGYGAMLQQVAGKSLEVLRGLVPSAIEQQAREFVGLYTQGEPPTPALRLALAHAHVREAADLCARAGTWEWNPRHEFVALLHRIGDAVRVVCREPMPPKE